MRELYSNIRGTSDFSPRQAKQFNAVTENARKVFRFFGYEEIILPLLEEAGLFVRGVGRATEMIERQMFSVTRKEQEKGKDIVLRPEGTAQIVRYYLQNALHKQSSFHKFFYIGAMFRGERPQRGRLRQFHHLGAEAIGSASLYLDLELIILALKVLEEIGIKERLLCVNTLGCGSDKEKFSKSLKRVLLKGANRLCADCQRRLKDNPLRVLDCKRESCRNIFSSLHLGEISLCLNCKKQFRDLLSLLDDSGVKYLYQPMLVRGLDYYTNTVFEITSKELGSQDALGAGGRYNTLIKDLGGPDTPAIGFALGVERILLALKKSLEDERLSVFVAVTEGSFLKEGFKLLDELRREGISSDIDYLQRSLKSQLRSARKKGAEYVVILAEEEWRDGCFILRDMDRSIQKRVKRNRLIDLLKKNVSDA